MADIKAKLDPKNTGTLKSVHLWNNKVPTPAQNIATDGSKPVSSGTNTVAPNIASKCWIDKMIFFILIPPKILIPYY